MRVVTGAGDEQHVRVPRRGDDAEAEALQVVVRAESERELVLAAVARAGVNVADGEASPARRDAGAPIVAAQAAEVSEERQHQRSAQA